MGVPMETVPKKRAWLGTTLVTLLVLFALAAPPAIGLIGCQSISDGAKATFSHDNTCPLERVEARERPDLRQASFSDSPRLPSTPPPDIANDPSRLKMWQEEQSKKAHSDDDHHIIEARGCDKHVFYDCRHSLSTDRVGGASWVCSEETYVPNSISGW